MSWPKVVSGVSLAAIAAAGGFWLARRPSPDRIVFLNVGQGDATLIQTGTGSILIDVGPGDERFDAGDRKVVPTLKGLGVSRLAAVVVTHPDKDHIGGLSSVLRAFPEALVVASDQFREDPELLSALGSKRKTVQWVRDRLHFSTSGWRLELVAPAHRPGESDNESSLFARWKHRTGAEAVFTGDAGMERELAFGRRLGWRAHLTKAGHHGSRFSTSSPWLAQLGARDVVISCGVANAFGHPHPAVLERIRATGARIWRTDLHGDIECRVQTSGFACR